MKDVVKAIGSVIVGVLAAQVLLIGVFFARDRLVEDGVSRSEIATAFKQRDAISAALDSRLKQLESAKVSVK